MLSMIDHRAGLSRRAGGVQTARPRSGSGRLGNLGQAAIGGCFSAGRPIASRWRSGSLAPGSGRFAEPGRGTCRHRFLGCGGRVTPRHGPASDGLALLTESPGRGLQFELGRPDTGSRPRTATAEAGGRRPQRWGSHRGEAGCPERQPVVITTIPPTVISMPMAVFQVSGSPPKTTAMAAPISGEVKAMGMTVVSGAPFMAA